MNEKMEWWSHLDANWPDAKGVVLGAKMAERGGNRGCAWGLGGWTRDESSDCSQQARCSHHVRGFIRDVSGSLQGSKRSIVM
jgi:hypothetical protein